MTGGGGGYGVRRAERAGDVRDKGSVFEVGDGGSSGFDGEGGDEWGELGWVGWGLRWGRRHILTSLFRANENGWWVSRGKNRERGESKETRTRDLKEGGDGEERVR